MPLPATVPSNLRHQVFRGSTAVRSGLLTPGQLRGPTWRRLFPDVYVHREAPHTHALLARAAAGVLLPEAVVTGTSAAVLWGVDLVEADDDVELTVPLGHHPVRVRGLRVRRALLPHGIVRRRGVAVTDPTTTALRLAAGLAPDDAVVALDRMLRAGVVEFHRLRAEATAGRGRGSGRARAAVALADGRAESPPETLLRLLLLRSGLPQPVAQYVVRSEGRFVARVDLAWPELRVAAEYDGLWHAEEGQFAGDRTRLNRLHAAGWRVVFVTAGDLRHPAEVLRQLTSALGDATVR